MSKRLFDFILALMLLVLLLPLGVVIAFCVWMQDRHSPFYIGRRVGRRDVDFGMLKFRSMRVAADRTGVMSTKSDDPRITALGATLRRFKLDELPQLINILKGDMSFVGPRPNVRSEVDLYSLEERHLLDVRPGITDFASIVFSDEGEILFGSANPDRDYNLLIRPWKSRLGLHYIRVRSLGVDLQLIAITFLSLLSRRRALRQVGSLLVRSGADDQLVRISGRQQPLEPTLPPGVTADRWSAHLEYSTSR
jgi:lipopolysaccharide/colanic/teichoic acid biosynthesis glycosyltransferase